MVDQVAKMIFSPERGNYHHCISTSVAKTIFSLVAARAECGAGALLEPWRRPPWTRGTGDVQVSAGVPCVCFKDRVSMASMAGPIETVRASNNRTAESFFFGSSYVPLKLLVIYRRISD